MRRAVTLFVGARELLEKSAVEPAKLPIRALFETTLAIHYLVYGAKKNVDLFSRSDSRQRECRARYYYVAGERRRLYGMQGMLDGRWGRRALGGKLRNDIKNEIAENVDRLRSSYPAQWAAFGNLRCFGARRALYYDDLPWYAYGFPSRGVRNVRQLAVRLGRVLEYEFFYSTLSGVIHPGGIHHDVKVTSQGLEVFHPYMAEAFELLVSLLTHWQIYIIAAATKAYQPSSLSDMQQVQKRISGLTLNLDSGLPDGFW